MESIKKKASISDQIDKIKEKKIDNLFPKFYRFSSDKQFYINEKDDKFFIVMEKMDKDLQTILIELIDKYMDKNSSLNIDIDYLNKNLPNTMNEPNVQERKTLKEYIDKNLNKYEIKKELVAINKDIIELHHKLLKNGFYYGDYKFDNIGVNIKNNNYEYKFLDIESGFREINYITPVEDSYIEIYLINFFRSSDILSYNINGQYSLQNLFGIENNYNDFIKNKIKLVEEKKIYVYDDEIFLIEQAYVYKDERTKFNHTDFTDYKEDIKIFMFKFEEETKYGNFLKYKIIKTNLQNFNYMNYTIQEDNKFTECKGIFYFQQVYNIFEDNKINRFIYTKETVKEISDILIDIINMTLNEFFDIFYLS